MSTGEADGTISVGDYDMVPLIDRFVEEHPDFSYRGAKGTIALTGYNGVLGYRTDISYKTRENLDDQQVKFFEENPDFNEETYNQEVEEATKVANAMKEEGWEFASHTWGHMNVTEASVDRLKTDTEKWLSYVNPSSAIQILLYLLLGPIWETGSLTVQTMRSLLT